MKKIIFSSLTITIIITQLLSCKGKPSYNEYKALPGINNLTLQKGKESFIPIKIEIQKDGYVYANPKGPGIGKAIEVFADKNENFEYKPTRYPKGEKYIAKGETSHVWVYKNEAYIFIPILTKTTANESNENITVYVNSLMCTNMTCIPQNNILNVPVKITSDENAATSFSQDFISKFNAAKSPEQTKDEKSAKTTKIKIETSFFKDYDFEPSYLEVGIGGILQAILYGLIAGILLNFMPCVLPVVSLKIMGFVKSAGESKKSLVTMGVLFSMGILVSFAILASLAAFFGYNWGGLFQHKLFLISMIAIIFILGLSMFGVFTINIPSFVSRNIKNSSNMYIDAFSKGLLATLLATPCSGPFLGGTLAWALAQPPLTIFAIFMSVGTGMALPYFILTINPKFLKFIPKPGPWMETFERIMGFLLIFTVVYLIGILELSAIKPAILFLAFLSVGLWQFGNYGSIVNSYSKRLISLIALLFIIFFGYNFSFNYIYTGDELTTIKSTPFSAEAILNNKNNNMISIVKFTADWCPNCKYVEKVSLNTEKVKELVEKNNIQLIVADITRKNPEAEELLNKLGNYSIPVLAVIPPGESFTRPICLRDIYSEDDVINAINKAIELKNK